MAKARIDLAFHPGAAEEYIAAYMWYCERGIHLGAAFEAEIDRAVRLISEFPKRWPIYEKKYRRLLARKFPYSLIY